MVLETDEKEQSKSGINELIDREYGVITSGLHSLFQKWKPKGKRRNSPRNILTDQVKQSIERQRRGYVFTHNIRYAAQEMAKINVLGNILMTLFVLDLVIQFNLLNLRRDQSLSQNQCLNQNPILIKLRRNQKSRIRIVHQHRKWNERN